MIIERTLKNPLFLFAAVCVWAVSASPECWGVEAGDTIVNEYDTREAPRFMLEKRLGKGAFGEVWAIHNEQDASDRKVVKFYHQAEYASFFFRRYQLIFSAQQELGSPRELLRLERPKIVTVYDENDSIRLRNVPAVFSERVEGSVASLQGRLRLTPDMPGLVPGQISRLYSLMHDISRAIAILYNLGVSHYDITPNNILVEGDRYLLGDLDSIAPIGSAPMSYAWEGYYAGVEYADGGALANYTHSHLGDAWSLGVVLFELIHGLTPLEVYLDDDSVARKYQGETPLIELRKDMRVWAENHKNFKVLVEAALDEAFDFGFPISSELARQVDAIKAFTKAALQIDPAERRDQLQKSAPYLKIFHERQGQCKSLGLQLMSYPRDVNRNRAGQ